jgi:phage nucleotide-binding protein
MAFSFKRTGEATASGVKLVVYGRAGAGKTRLIPTLPNPFILSAEGGLLSIQDANLPYIDIDSMGALTDVYSWIVGSHEAQAFESIAIDSLSEIAEVCLAGEKRTAKDPRQAYGAMQDIMTQMIRTFRDLPRFNVYMTAKAEKTQDESGRMLYAPSMPGNKAGQALPYFFDEILALRSEVDTATGAINSALMCRTDGLWEAKDRSGRLAMWEAPDLGAIINKIRGNNV